MRHLESMSKYLNYETYDVDDYVLAFRGKMYICQVVDKDITIHMVGDSKIEKHITYLLVAYDNKGKHVGLEVKEFDNNDPKKTIIRKLNAKEIEQYKLYSHVDKYNL